MDRARSAGVAAFEGHDTMAARTAHAPIEGYADGIGTIPPRVNVTAHAQHPRAQRNCTPAFPKSCAGRCPASDGIPAGYAWSSSGCPDGGITARSAFDGLGGRQPVYSELHEGVERQVKTVLAKWQERPVKGQRAR